MKSNFLTLSNDDCDYWNKFLVLFIVFSSVIYLIKLKKNKQLSMIDRNFYETKFAIRLPT